MRVAVLSGRDLDDFPQAVLAPLLRRNRHTVVGCPIDARLLPSLPKRLWRNRPGGHGGYVVVIAATLALRRHRATVQAEELLLCHGVPAQTTDDPYAHAARDGLRQAGPDVVLLIGGIGPPLLSGAPYGVLSHHHGDLRRSRGQPPAFWELYNGEPELGPTVQRLSKALDAGEPIVEHRVRIDPGGALRTLQHRAFADSAGMLFDAGSPCRAGWPSR